MKPLIIAYKGAYPKIAEDAFIAPGAVIIGDVEIGSKSGIWFGCVIRGDVAKITIGEGTNIQDGTIIHVTRGGVDTIIGSGVTIGHKCLLHGCVIEDNAFIGMSSTLMDRSLVESFSMLAAGSLLSQKKIVKKGEIWAGNPAKLFRAIKEEEEKYITISAQNYQKHVEEYLEIFS